MLIFFFCECLSSAICFSCSLSPSLPHFSVIYRSGAIYFFNYKSPLNEVSSFWTSYLLEVRMEKGLEWNSRLAGSLLGSSAKLLLTKVLCERIGLVLSSSWQMELGDCRAAGRAVCVFPWPALVPCFSLVPVAQGSSQSPALLIPALYRRCFWFCLPVYHLLGRIWNSASSP